MSGALYVVSTPIGNLGDITRRAAETLGAADRIVAEDTRRTRALLSHLGIGGKPVAKLDAHAGERTLEELVTALEGGESIALVTDAGTPSVSDPGTDLVRLAAARGVTVIAIPGPSAVTAAVAVSGLVDGPFLFLGFPPRKGEKRRRLIRRIATSREPVVLFEAPNRIRETLADLAEVAPARAACVARELTKLHEELTRGTLAELARRDVMERGEFTVVVAGNDEPDEADDADVDSLVAARLDSGDSARTIADDVAEVSGRPRREIYARVLELRRARGDDV
ncbi:MAG TPA: 16S rRNA (cytidine(1402)-2'-O)-methyltransferase [Polyangiaceae bacterium]|jgi:16S rRNA (cytidine1402-2'-O)-methyltransferase|nr:16S rRNA (cytidine(1402)-2'-O)-methyltransferase [Polyangiaceae bacterium]